MPAALAYHIIEPHPSVPSSTRQAVHTSRGGAGNVISLRNTTTTNSRTAMGPASLTCLNVHPPTTFKSGRGGAGNVHSTDERTIFSFDEELELALRREREVAPVFHVGRGGAGNMVHSQEDNSLFRHHSGSGSTSSTESMTNRAREMARRSLEKGWNKLTGTR
ncbi:hypothetical protein V8E54_003815 [Elaphomyces granulatus]